MREIKPPANNITLNRTIFLAGSIEMGVAENWQDYVCRLLKDTDYDVLNPRRDDWDSSWKQEIENDQFREQVNWELNGLETADHILMYFDPATKSPISLLELGLYANSNKIRVCCPYGFYRKGNVDIVCKRYNIKQFSGLKEMVEDLLKK